MSINIHWKAYILLGWGCFAYSLLQPVLISDAQPPAPIMGYHLLAIALAPVLSLLGSLSFSDLRVSTSELSVGGGILVALVVTLGLNQILLFFSPILLFLRTGKKIRLIYLISMAAALPLIPLTVSQFHEFACKAADELCSKSDLSPLTFLGEAIYLWWLASALMALGLWRKVPS